MQGVSWLIEELLAFQEGLYQNVVNIQKVTG